MNVLETLQSEHADLTQRLNELDERHRTERPVLVAQLGQLTKAIAALTKPAKVPGERKQMSEEGKAAIRAGLEKARAAKAATASTAGPATVQSSGGEAPTEKASTSNTPGTPIATRKLTVAEKGPTRAN
jgi:peptidoglycan hydrolase CwlO-like protein